MNHAYITHTPNNAYMAHRAHRSRAHRSGSPVSDVGGVRGVTDRRAEARRSGRNRSPCRVLAPRRTAATVDKSWASTSPPAPTSNLRDEQVPVNPTA